MKALYCQACNNRCYYDNEGNVNSLENQISYHYFLGWPVKICADFAQLSLTDTESILTAAKVTLDTNGRKTRESFNDRYTTVKMRLFSGRNTHQFSVIMDEIERLHYDIAQGALYVMQRIPLVKVFHSTEEVLSLQRKVQALEQEANSLHKLRCKESTTT